MMTYYRDVDSKYHAFFLEYYKFQDSWHSHMVRPTVATYEDLSSPSKDITYILESAIATFSNEDSLSQILLECSLLGILIDFILIFVPCKKTTTSWQNYKIFQVIDTHKEDISKYVESVDLPRFYVTTSTKKSDILKFLVVDRINLDPKIEFLKGKYDKNAVVAGFKDRKNAYEMCKKLIEANNN